MAGRANTISTPVMLALSDGPATAKQVMQITGFKSSQVQHALVALMKDGTVVREGDPPGSVYRLIEDEKEVWTRHVTDPDTGRDVAVHYFIDDTPAPARLMVQRALESRIELEKVWWWYCGV